MGSMMVFLLLAMGSGAGMSPALVQMIVSQRKESFRKWKTIIDNLQQLIVAGYFYFIGPQQFLQKDGTPDTSNAAIAGRITAFQQDSLNQSFFGTLLNTIVRTVLELLQPSDAETALMTALLSGQLGAGRSASAFTAPSQNVMLNAAPSGPRTASQVLQGGPQGAAPRAQGLIINTDGSVVTY